MKKRVIGECIWNGGACECNGINKSASLSCNLEIKSLNSSLFSFEFKFFLIELFTKFSVFECGKVNTLITQKTTFRFHTPFSAVATQTAIAPNHSVAWNDGGG